MTWLAKPLLLRIFVGVAAAWLLTLPVGIPTAHAQNWGEIAVVSENLGVSDSRICIGDGTRGDMGCPSFAPTISPTGRIHATAGLTVDSISLTTTGTTWGYLGSGASYLPNLSSNAISATNISATTINGISVSALGGASPTNVPSFRVHRNGVDQTGVTGNQWSKVLFTTKEFDRFTNYDLGTNRFTPTIAGTYIFTGSVYCLSQIVCYVGIYKNGSLAAMQGLDSASGIVTQVNLITYMNGTTDYIELFSFAGSTYNIYGFPSHTSFQGSLLASGNGLVSGTGATALSGLTDVTLASPATGQVLTYNGTAWVNATPSATTVISGTTTMVEGWPDAIVCAYSGAQVTPLYYGYSTASTVLYFSGDVGSPWYAEWNRTTKAWVGETYSGTLANCQNKSISQLYADGQAFNFIGNSGAGGGALGDRLTSGTLAVTANSATAIVSLTTGGTTWGYLGSAGSYLPNLTSSKVSATSISTTAVQVVSATAPLTCDSSKAGTLRYNSTNTALELCTGTGWQMMGVGIPAGTISAFASTTCPTGWSEYTAARGRFLRGIDNAAGNDPGGTRVPGDVQEDTFQGWKLGSNLRPDFTNLSILNERIGGNAYSQFSGMVLTSDNSNTSGAGGSSRVSIVNDGSNGIPRTSSETRPKNVAVTYCQFNGTSNGWNNPLSGGSTVPGGSTGQIQYNTSGSFDASAGLTWDNAASRLTTVNISATALTVNGVAITGSASGDRIVSGSTSAIASPSGTIAVSGSLNVSGAVVGESFTVSTTVNMRNNPSATCISGTLGAVTQINSKLYFCRM